MKVGLLTLGCAKNEVDSEVMAKVLTEQDYEIIDDYQQAEVLIVNTCGFINDAKEESIESILTLASYKESGNCKKLIVTGCLAQRYKDDLSQDIPEIDAFLGTGEMDQIARVINEAKKDEQLKDSSYFDYDQYLPENNLGDEYSSYVKIAEGCNNNCSYCVIPQLRGQLKSRKLEKIIAEVEKLAESGVKEINIIAQDITQYGLDLYGESKLLELLERLLEIKGIKWFRLLYAYPAHLQDELIDLIAREDRICNYLDLPIQHVNQRIRKDMKRSGSKQEIMTKINKLRDKIPDIALRTSIIVGFPGESEAEFKELLSFVEKAEFDRLGAFTYSQEEGTLAAKMKEQIPQDLKEERKDRLMELQKEISYQRNQNLLGQKVTVLVEEIESSNDLRIARTQWDAPEVDGEVYVKDSKAEVGEMIEVEIVEAYEYDLMGVDCNELTE